LGYTNKGSLACINFRNRRNGIMVAFSAKAWFGLGELMAKALPELHSGRTRRWLATRFDSE